MTEHHEVFPDVLWPRTQHAYGTSRKTRNSLCDALLLHILSLLCGWVHIDTSPRFPLALAPLGRVFSKLVEAGGVLIKRKRCPYGTGSYARRTRAVEIAAQAGQGSVCGKAERGRGEAEPESEIIAIVGGKGATGGDEGIFSRGPGTANEGKSSSPALTVTVSPSSPVPLSSRSSSTPLADEGESTRTVSEPSGVCSPQSLMVTMPGHGHLYLLPLRSICR